MIKDSSILIFEENGAFTFGNLKGKWITDQYGINFISNENIHCDSITLAGPFNAHFIGDNKWLLLRHKLYLTDISYYKCEFVFQHD